jgi:hypothetical protein
VRAASNLILSFFALTCSPSCVQSYILFLRLNMQSELRPILYSLCFCSQFYIFFLFFFLILSSLYDPFNVTVFYYPFQSYSLYYPFQSYSLFIIHLNLTVFYFPSQFFSLFVFSIISSFRSSPQTCHGPFYGPILDSLLFSSQYNSLFFSPLALE